jgi:hypothetical protein
MRVKRIVLEHHRYVALLRGQSIDDLVADPKLSLGDVLEPGDHLQRRRLAAARGANEDHKLAVLNVEGHVLDRLDTVRVPLR